MGRGVSPSSVDITDDPTRQLGLTRTGPAQAVVAVGSRAVAPGAGATVTGTGPLPAGDYRVELVMSYSGALAAGKGMNARHLDAAVAFKTQVGGCPAGDSREITVERITILQNESIVIINETVAAGAGEALIGAIRAYRLT